MFLSRRDKKGSDCSQQTEPSEKSYVRIVAEILLLLAAIAAFALSERDLFQDILIFYLFCFKCQQK